MSVFDVLVLIDLAGTRILKLLDDLSCLITLPVDLGLFGYSLLTPVLDHGLLADGLAHASASEAAETAGLEAGETSAAKAPTEETVIVVHHHHTKRIGPPLLLRLPLLTACAAAHATVHTIEEAAATEGRCAEPTSKKVVIVVEKAGEWISATEELLENVIGITHIEVSGLEAGEIRLASASSAGRAATLLEEFSAIPVVVLTLFRISEYAISIRYLLKDFLCFFLAVGVLVWMVLE